MASSGNGPQQSQHVQGAAEGLFARVKQVASGILAEVGQAGAICWNESSQRSRLLLLVASAMRGSTLHVAIIVQCCFCNKLRHLALVVSKYLLHYA